MSGGEEVGEGIYAFRARVRGTREEGNLLGGGQLVYD
jgi:hypothetical protein